MSKDDAKCFKHEHTISSDDMTDEEMLRVFGFVARNTGKVIPIEMGYITEVDTEKRTVTISSNPKDRK